jgi:hypothetical protein
MKWLRRNLSLILSAIATAIFLGYAVKQGFVGIPFAEDLVSKVPGLLGSLLIVSLFVERVIEVFVSIWRDERTDMLEQQLANYQDLQARRKQEIAALLNEASDPNNPPTDDRKGEIKSLLNEKRGDLEKAEKGEDLVKEQLVPKYAHMRRITAWIGLAVGVLASTVGFRFFNQIVAFDKIPLNGPQKDWFICVDALLTGAILAGGSKAIHSIFSVYQSFMNSTEKRTTASATAAAARSASDNG